MRDARDIAGQHLAVGDKVATLMPHYRYTLVLGTVTKITPKMLRVTVEGDEHYIVADCQVAKVPS